MKRLTITNPHKLVGQWVVIRTSSQPLALSTPYQVYCVVDLSDVYKIVFHDSDICVELDKKIDYILGASPYVKMRCGKIGLWKHTHCSLEHLQTIPDFVKRISNVF